MRPVHRRTGTVRRRRAFHRALSGVVAIAATLPSSAGGGAVSAAEPQGRWSAPFDLGVIGIHSTLLRTGEVLLFEYPGEVGSRAKLFKPGSPLVDVSSTRERSFFCSGHVVLSDGRVLVAGGTVYDSGGNDGVRATDFFNPVNRTWKKGPAMSWNRWYPTTVRLPNGKTLIFSGQRMDGEPIALVEEYDPATNRIRTLPASATKLLDNYPRMVLLQNGKLFWAGEEAGTWTFDPATNRWTFVDTMAFYRYAGSAVVLPGLNKVLAMGGAGDSGAIRSAEIIDFSAPHPQWRVAAPMHRPRQYLNAVLLLDGTVLVVGGGNRDLYDEPQRAAELFDPATETWTLMAPQTAGRMYHSTAVLLPDGRVLSSGQDSGALAETGELFSPPYLFKGTRPKITSAPAGVGYGGSMSIGFSQASAISRVALLRPGSVTHAVNFEQRYVDLAFTVNGGTIEATAPPNGNVAPPGWYLLSVLNGAGVPAVARWVKVS